MNFKSVLITGGAGFVGSSLSCLFKESFPGLRVAALDNLKRRGSELNLTRLKAAGVEFVHGDIRCREDLAEVKGFELLVDCSAEASVQSGLSGSPDYLLQTNLVGSMNCMEWARHYGAAFIFLSTSRVYPIASINRLEFENTERRFVWKAGQEARGFSPQGISEEFSLEGARSFYGASKLAGELLLQEYSTLYRMPVIINRCGVLTGPWQMGKVDQGVIALWVARHWLKKPLKYIGFDGAGQQVRDILHVRDLFELLCLQIQKPEHWRGDIYNIGGGLEVSVSLKELSALCQEVTGNAVPITPEPATSPVDVRIYLSDSRKALRDFGWKPRTRPDHIVADIHGWMTSHRDEIAQLF